MKTKHKYRLVLGTVGALYIATTIALTTISVNLDKDYDSYRETTKEIIALDEKNIRKLSNSLEDSKDFNDKVENELKKVKQLRKDEKQSHKMIQKEYKYENEKLERENLKISKENQELKNELAKLNSVSKKVVATQKKAEEKSSITKVSNDNVSGYNGWKRMTVNASAYTTYDNGDKLASSVYGNITASGKPVHWGGIAVDTNVIPMGTKVYIPMYNMVFTSTDTGSAIKGNRIDIYMDSLSQANSFGRRNIEVFVER